MAKTLIQAHRGASAYAPENTLPAFQMAVDMGADGIECDIHLTRDGQFVVCHDETVNRTSDGTGRIAAKTLAELKTLDFGVKFDSRFAGTRIPTLEEMLDVVGGMRVINIEIKRFDHPMGQAAASDRFYELLTNKNVLSRTIVSSFDEEALKVLKQRHPDTVTCLLYSGGKNKCETADKLHCSAIHPDFAHLTAAEIDKAHGKGMKVNCWTPNSQEDIRRQILAGCDGIITNYPDRALELVKESAQNENGSL